MCNHHSEKHRPTPLALAVMWNAQDTVADLLFMGANPFMQVWFSEVLDMNGQLVVDEDAVEIIQQKNGLTIFYLQQLPQIMFDRNVHRFVEGYIEKKISNWKDLCRDHLSDLDRIIKGEFHRVRLDQKDRAIALEIKLEKERIIAEKKAADLAVLREKREKQEKPIE